MGQTQVKTFRGLFSQMNQINKVPDGACVVADNVVGDREGIVSKRRGFNLYGTVLSNPAGGLFEYSGRLIVLDGTTLKYDSDNAGTWSSWSGTYSAPTGYSMVGHETQKNFYFTTSAGVYMNDALTNTPKRSGIGEGLDMATATSVGGTVWLTNNYTVSYRILFGRTDANNNEKRGSPSYRHWATNTLGGDAKVTLTCTVHPDCIAGDFYEVYRTAMVTGIDPGDEHFKLLRTTLTSTDITNGYITFVDDYDETYLGERLYTNPTQEGILNANDRAPYATCLATFKGHTFYGNTRETHWKEFQMIDRDVFDDTTPGQSTIVLTVGATAYTYTCGTAEDIGNKIFKKEIDPALTEAQRIEYTCKSLCRVINRDATCPVLAFYISESNDAPGKLLFELETLADTAIYFTSNNAGAAFTPAMPTSGVTCVSANNAMLNGLYRSKFEIPEAVPVLNYDSVGKANKKILNIVALTESLLIFKEDGVFRLTGDTDGASGNAFNVEELDPTVVCLANSSLTSLNSSAYAFTTQGVVKANANGSMIVSRPIEPDLVTASQWLNFATITQGCSYEKDRKYILLTQGKSTDTYPTKLWIYNYLTDTWVSWSKKVKYALVLSADNKLYMTHATKNYVLKERKSYLLDNQDFMDETVSGTITAVTTATNSAGVTVSQCTITFDWSDEPKEGWQLAQGTLKGLVRTVTKLTSTSFTLVLDRYLSALATGAATLSISIISDIQWVPQVAENVTAMKQFTKLHLYFEKDFALRSKVAFQSDRQSTEKYSSDVTIQRLMGWGRSRWGSSEWGDAFTGTSTPISTNVPLHHQRCRALRVRFVHKEAKETFDLLQMALVVRPYTEIRIEQANV